MFGRYAPLGFPRTRRRRMRSALFTAMVGHVRSTPLPPGDLRAMPVRTRRRVPERPKTAARRARGVRRWRRAAAAVVAALTVVVLAPASGLATAPGQDLGGSAHVSTRAAHCPEEEWKPRSLGGPSGRLAAPGAFAVTLCVYPFSTPGERAPKPMAEGITLTRGADRLLDTLDRLPPGPESDPVCTLMGLPTFQLILAYRDRPPAPIDLEFNCDIASSRSAIRSDAGKALNTFARLYREQAAATVDPRTLKAPGCPVRMEASGVFAPSLADRSVDRVIQSFLDSAEVVPAPLAVAAFCRYDRSGESLRLARQVSVRADLKPLRSILDKAFTSATDPSRTDSSEAEALMDCQERTTPSRLDIVWTVDVTGAVQERRVLRAPCAAVIRRGFGRFAPGPALIALLDRLLA